jgi:hypothetical protein
MKIVLESAAIFLICVVISLISTIYALIITKLALVRAMMNFSPLVVLTPSERLATKGFVLPFALFSFGAVVQNQLHHDLLAPAASLLVAAVFIGFPFFARIGWELIDHRWLDRRTRNLPWNRKR